MFANRYTAFIDACVLVGVMKRHIILNLAEAEFFRVRWSAMVLEETRVAIEAIMTKHGKTNVEQHAAKVINTLETCFCEANVDNYDRFLCVCEGFPDNDDAHVVAAAIKAQAATIVTDNLKDFPRDKIDTLNLEVRSADEFITDTISLDEAKAVAAIKKMRVRFHNPALNQEQLLLKMEACGLTLTADILRPYIESI